MLSLPIAVTTYSLEDLTWVMVQLLISSSH